MKESQDEFLSTAIPMDAPEPSKGIRVWSVAWKAIGVFIFGMLFYVKELESTFVETTIDTAVSQRLQSLSPPSWADPEYFHRVIETAVSKVQRPPAVAEAPPVWADPEYFHRVIEAVVSKVQAPPAVTEPPPVYATPEYVHHVAEAAVQRWSNLTQEQGTPFLFLSLQKELASMEKRLETVVQNRSGVPNDCPVHDENLAAAAPKETEDSFPKRFMYHWLPFLFQGFLSLCGGIVQSILVGLMMLFLFGMKGVWKIWKNMVRCLWRGCRMFLTWMYSGRTPTYCRSTVEECMQRHGLKVGPAYPLWRALLSEHADVRRTILRSNMRIIPDPLLRELLSLFPNTDRFQSEAVTYDTRRDYLYMKVESEELIIRQ